MDSQFLNDVIEGLTSCPKFLNSKYFYDEQGDRLFQKIMNLDEYYLTRSEYEIFSHYKDEMKDHFLSECDIFHLIEFGAGDAFKTKVLIDHFIQLKSDFEYNPIDISSSILNKLSRDLNKTYPDLKVKPINLEYFSALEEISKRDTCKKVILFLGSNIGNFSSEQSHEFFGKLAKQLSIGDQLLTGFDLKKDPLIIKAAYDDSKGITAAFNLNLLTRINRELESDIDPDNFYHYSVYDPGNGAVKSYLVSKEYHEVNIKGYSKPVTFTQGETIFTEISQKYDIADITRFADKAGFKILSNFFDRQNYFVNSLWELT